MKKLDNFNIFRVISLTFHNLDERVKVRIVRLACAQSLMGFLDLIALASIGLLSAFAISNVSASETPKIINYLLASKLLGDLTFQQQFAILTTLTILLLVMKTIYSALLTRKLAYLLSHSSSYLTTKLSKSLLRGSLSRIEENSKQTIAFALTRGVEVIVLQILAPTILLLSDILLLLLLMIGLVALDWSTGLATILFFSIVTFVLHQLSSKNSKKLGLEISKNNVESNQLINSTLSLFRVLKLRGALDDVANLIGESRVIVANSLARLSFLQFAGKYIVEVSLILGAAIIGTIQLALKDFASAAVNFVLFLAAGVRIAPSILRVQQSLLLIRSGIGLSEKTLELMLNLTEDSEVTDHRRNFEESHLRLFSPKIQLRNVHFAYALDKRSFSLKDISLEVETRQLVALTGKSGCGKSSLVDLILGFHEPQKGSVLISGLSVREAIQFLPGKVGYVPQEVSCMDGSIKQNILMGLREDEYQEVLLREALDFANLSEFVDSLPDGLQHILTENGRELSGGQKQRIGIARAIITKPQLLVLDEATSGLDTISESIVLEKIRRYVESGEDRLAIVVTHKESILQKVDNIIFMDNGSIREMGSFDKLKNDNKSFLELISSLKTSTNFEFYG